MSSHVQRDLEGFDGRLLPSIVEIPQPLRFKKAYIFETKYGFY